MAAEKVTVSLDRATHAFARQAADLRGMTLARWLSQAVRREAVRDGVCRFSDPGAVAAAAEVEAQADFDELVSAQEHLRTRDL